MTRDGKSGQRPRRDERRHRRVVDDRAAPPDGARPRTAPQPKGKGEVQVSRLGNPLINELIIPLAHKDQFNSTTPDRDAALYGKYAVNPEPARLLNALFGLGVKDDQPDGHRHGAADRHPRQDADRARTRSRPTR